jgi:hemoglobin
VRKLISFGLASLFIVGFAQTTFAAKAKTATEKPLFDRLGGKKGIEKVVKDFVENRVAKDEKINKFFGKTDIKHLEAMLTDQICQATSPNPKKPVCTYHGKSMKDAHKGMGVTEADFKTLVDHLVESLKAAGVSEGDIGTIASVLLPMKTDIVEGTTTTN